MEFIIPYITLSIIVAWIATGKKRSGCGFFIFSLLFSPVITLIVLLVIGEKKKEEINENTKKI